MNHGQYNVAQIWLVRGCQACANQDHLSEDVDVSELRLNLMHMHGRFLLDQKNLRHFGCSKFPTVRAILAGDNPEASDKVFETLEALRAVRITRTCAGYFRLTALGVRGQTPS